MALIGPVRDRFLAPLARSGPILPLLGAEFVIWTGFGALIPVLPLYLRDNGVDLALLGVVTAAWPATRLVAEPLFGYLADRTARVPLMVAGLVLAAAATALTAVLGGVAIFATLRALAGLGAAIYDPAARGYLTDATVPERRGEVFGLYNAAQMGGFLLGPAIGGVGAAWFGGFEFTIWFGAVSAVLAALVVLWRVRELPRAPATSATGAGVASIPPEGVSGFPVEVLPADGRPGATRPVGPRAPTTLRNRLLAVAIVGMFTGYLAGGLYETVWSLFLESRGGSLELIGLTFAVFALTTIVASPVAGRMVDRSGPRPFVIGGVVVMAVAMLLYPILPDVRLAVLVIVLEALGFAFSSPAMFTVVAAGAPEGRTSTAQGIVGSAGTLGTILASLATGVLAAIDLALPFYAGAVVATVLLGVLVVIGWRPLGTLRPAPRVAQTNA